MATFNSTAVGAGLIRQKYEKRLQSFLKKAFEVKSSSHLHLFVDIGPSSQLHIVGRHLTNIVRFINFFLLTTLRRKQVLEFVVFYNCLLQFSDTETLKTFVSKRYNIIFCKKRKILFHICFESLLLLALLISHWVAA